MVSHGEKYTSVYLLKYLFRFIQNLICNLQVNRLNGIY